MYGCLLLENFQEFFCMQTPYPNKLKITSMRAIIHRILQMKILTRLHLGRVLKVVLLQNENERGRDMKWGQNRLCWHMWKSYSPPQKQLCSALQHQLFPLVYICCERRFKNWRSTQKSLRTGCCIILLQFIFKHP
ncbi:hypothetical protein KSP40_PGU016433 [Platanthera guangdongensis]|uniref:Uncharacterized protein n=1 Tax=Platanthera guangdongensis TaxID=2320717 RepID=A0ABR2M7Z0_9ASPA